jgi:hypothetical protein
MRGARLEEENLSENDLVIQLFELLEEGLGHSEGLAIIESFNVTEVSDELNITTHRATSLISRLCRRKTRFSLRAHSMFSLVTRIWRSRAEGGKRSIRARTM